jgi:hypothetical protein
MAALTLLANVAGCASNKSDSASDASAGATGSMTGGATGSGGSNSGGLPAGWKTSPDCDGFATGECKTVCNYVCANCGTHQGQINGCNAVKAFKTTVNGCSGCAAALESWRSTCESFNGGVNPAMLTCTGAGGTVAGGTGAAGTGAGGTGAGGTGAGAGQALKTTASSDRVNAMGVGLPLGNAARTVEALIKTTDTGEKFAVSYGTLARGQAVYIGIENGLAVVTQNGDSIRGTTTVNDDKWHHIAATYAGAATAWDLWVDGKKEATKVMTTNTVGTQLVVGSTITGENKPLAGEIDEVRIWNVARTADQLLANMRRPALGTEPGLVLYYDMNVTGAGTNIKVPNKATATGAVLDGITAGGPTTPSFVPSTF